MASSLSTHAVNCTSAARSTGGASASARPSSPPQLRGCGAHVGCKWELEGLHGSEIANVAVSVGDPMISATSCAPMRSYFFLSDFSSRRAVFGCIAHVCITANPIQNLCLTQHQPHSLVNWLAAPQELAAKVAMVSVSIIEAVRRECRPQSEKLTLSSSGVARAPRPHEKSRARRDSPDLPILDLGRSRFPDFLDVRTGLAQPSPRMPHPRSLPCALHTSTCMHSTLDTHAARMRASPATCTCTHTATCAHTSKASCGSSCHWQLADCRPARC